MNPRRFRARLWFAFLAVLALIGLGTLVLSLTSWSGLSAFAVGLALVTGAGMVVRFAVTRLARPVELLTEATRRFGEGDLGHRIAVPPRFLRWFERRRRRPHRPSAVDELVALALAWNQMAERIEQLVKGQRELMANVSHELRSPLTRVRLALELVPRTPDTAGRLDDVALDLDELERLIEDTLTATRLQAAGLPAHLAEVDIAELLRTLAERAAIDPLVADKALVVEQAPGTTRVQADAALLRRALWNLIENAAKYGAPPIVLSAAKDGGGVRFSVADAGAGVPEDVRARLFQPFARAAAHRGMKGFGLGLTIAQRVAEVHGGTIRCVPLAPGTRFDLVLPAS